MSGYGPEVDRPLLAAITVETAIRSGWYCVQHPPAALPFTSGSHLLFCGVDFLSRAGVPGVEASGLLGQTSRISVAAASIPIVSTLLSGPAWPPVRKSGPVGFSFTSRAGSFRSNPV